MFSMLNFSELSEYLDSWIDDFRGRLSRVGDWRGLFDGGSAEFMEWSDIDEKTAFLLEITRYVQLEDLLNIYVKFWSQASSNRIYILLDLPGTLRHYVGEPKLRLSATKLKEILGWVECSSGTRRVLDNMCDDYGKYLKEYLGSRKKHREIDDEWFEVPLSSNGKTTAS